MRKLLCFREKIAFFGEKMSSFGWKRSICGRSCPKFGPKVALLGGNVIVLEKGGISWGECVLFGSQRCTLGGKSGLSGRKCPSLGRKCHSAECGVAD